MGRGSVADLSVEEEKEETKGEPSTQATPQKVPVTVIFNQHAHAIRTHDANFDVTAFAKKARAKDNSGHVYYKVVDNNMVSYRYTSEAKLASGDHSLIEFELSPEKVGSFMMHVLIGKGKGAVEIAGSPYNVLI